MIRFAQVLRNSDGDWFLQIAKHSDLTAISTKWQADLALGDICHTPSIDLEDSLIPCVDYKDAMYKLALHYKSELEKS